ncbi:alpha-ketoglutarate-dependent dioxygenase AlkB [Pseudopontixanthobacter vadosimaris]|uniref:alpha-ketoglutarate-dependent dioxygenase AlkB n=1 Tax=Pseudopontixanthobacter vadosimaris TaxID=2726450 RepID=UPI001F104DB8|nr:alpha-ketoglutarate-dependent dioxygenase AlkB [Pseudopontixanthobacter vadosimaris]
MCFDMMRQGNLFANGSGGAPPLAGLRLVEDAITARMEAGLADRIDAAPLAPFRFQRWEGKRLTAHYGRAYDHEKGVQVEADPLPGWLLELRATLASLLGTAERDWAQALLIRYDPGAGIGWHRDRPIYGRIMGLSLGAPAVMRFRRRLSAAPGEGERARFARLSVTLPPRSLYLLEGAARQDWEHSIAPMEVTRRSITFRTLR